jgi:hypothetical protein
MPLIKFINPASRYKWFNVLWMLALLAFPLVLWILPVDSIDNTGFELCPSKALFNVECFGCGLTRATMYMHHFEWQQAIYHNYGIVLVYPVLAFLWFWWLRKALFRHQRFIRSKNPS